MTHYEIYDGRYLSDPDRAICLTPCDTIEEARIEKHEYGTDTVIVKAVLQKVGEQKYEEVSSEVVK